MLRNSEIKNENDKVLWEIEGDFDHATQPFGDSLPTKNISYKNRQPEQKVKSIELLGYGEDTTISFNLKEENFAEIAAALIKANLPKPDFIRARLNNYRLNLPNLETLNRCLNAVASIDPTINTIKNEIVLTFFPYSKKEPTIPNWLKEKDFDSRNFGRGSFLIREQKYVSTNQDSKIEELCMLGYKDGDIVVTIKTKKNEFKTLANELVKAEFLPPSYDELEAVFRTNIPNMQYLKTFLDILAKAEPTINSIEDLVINAAAPYSKEELTIEGWVKSGDFGYVHHEGQLDRMESYENTNPLANIKKIELLGYNGGDIRIFIDLKQSNYEKLLKPLVEKNFCEFHVSKRYAHINIQNKEKFEECLKLLIEVEPSINNISNHLKQAYKKAENYQPLPLSLYHDNLNFQDEFGFLREEENIFMLNSAANTVIQSFSKASSTFFARKTQSASTTDMLKDISDEEMSNSTFGQECNSAKNMKH